LLLLDITSKDEDTMTFIDNRAEKPSTAHVVLFSITSFFFFLCAIVAFQRGRTRRHYRATFPVWCLFPIACLISMLENIVLATSGIFIEKKMDDTLFLKVVFVLQAFQVPILLVTIFELTYIVHKRRSVNFCGLYFDEGRRVQSIITTRWKSFLARNALRIIALLMLAIGIFVNLDLLGFVSQADQLTGRVGWANLWNDNSNWNEAHTLVLISLFPTAILVISSVIMSISLWRYGTESSLMVHSSFLNIWFFPFFGTLALAGGQLFAESWYPFTSNLGLLIFVITVLMLQTEIDKDVNITAEFTDFLHRVAKKGDATIVQPDMDDDDDNGYY